MLRCRRCRKEIIDSTSLLAGKDADESPATVCSIWHVNVEALPEWMLTSVHQARWTVGKLNCHSCSARLGGFDFIHHFECPCGQDAAVHLNKSRVDPEHKPRFSTVQPRAVKPTKEQSHRPMVESQREESTRDSTRLPWSQPKHATAISSPPVCSESGSTSGNSPADTLSCWLMSADAHKPPQLEAAGEASAGSCSLLPARRHSEAHHLPRQPLEDAAPAVETSGVREKVERASPASVIVTEAEVQAEAILGSSALNRLSKREKNRLKGLRRKQRKKERWLHCQLEKAEELLPNSEEEKEDREGLTCAVCLDVYVCPHVCRPCGHSFCEPCLRAIASKQPTNTPCPLCRTLISHADLNKELDQAAQTFFPNVYCARKQNFRSAACAKWPLPSTRKSFCTFWREQRRAARTLGHWRFHHHGLYSLAALDQTNMHAGLFDICLLILYIRSANWILVFLFLSVLVYYFCF